MILKKVVLHIALLLCLHNPLQAQSLSREYVRAENIRASELNSKGKFQEADRILQRLLDFLEENKADENLFAITYQTRAKVVQNLGDYDRSTAFARKALQNALKKKDSFNIADNYNTIGINHYFLSDFDSTIYYYQRSFDLKKKILTDAHSLAVSAYNLGIVFEDLGQDQRAMGLYKEAEGYLQGLGPERNFLPDVYVGIAQIYFYSGDIEKAEEYAEKAYDMALDAYGKDNPSITFIYASYANILEAKEKYDEAIGLLEKSLAIRRESYGEYHRWTCETNYDLANIYVKNREYDKAEELFRKAIDIGDRTNSIQYLANARTYLASMYLDRGMNLHQAEVLLLQSLEKNREVFGDKNEIVAENYYYLAKLAFLRKQEEAMNRYIAQNLNSSNYDKNDISQVIAPLDVIHSLLLLGDWYERSYLQTGESDLLIRWYELLDQEIALIKHTQSKFSTDRSKISLANEFRRVFEKGLNLCWILYYQTGDEAYLQKAFELSETNRNTALLQGLQESRLLAFGQFPEEISKLEKNTKSELEKTKMDLYYEKQAEQPDKEYYSELLEKRILLSNRLDSIHNSLLRDYPAYSELKYRNKSVRLEEVQGQLDESDQMIAYFLGDEYLYSFTLTRDTVKFLRGDVARRLVDKTETLKAKLVNREEMGGESRELFLYLLFQQLVPSKNSLLIVADNVLNYLPFEILKEGNGDYILENFDLSYAGSAGLFLELEDERFHYSSGKEWAGFSPAYHEGQKLSATEEEVTKIADLLDGDAYTGANASKKNFLEHKTEYSVLHLAMHAEIDNNNPSYNKLLFLDGDLTSSEIYLSGIRANLAVLSACNTGFGKLEKGEGVMSMARAFHASGVPAVLMSLWKVPDRETKDILVLFYKHLRLGRTKSEALRRAKLDYLDNAEDADLKHPYYWAGFVLNGDSGTMDLGRNSNLYVAGAFLMLFLLVLWGYSKSKRVQSR